MVQYDFDHGFDRQTLELFGSHINCGVMLCGGSKFFHVLYCNERLMEYLGSDRYALLATDRTYLDWVHPEDREYVQATVTMALDDKDDYDLIYRVSKHDGGVLWIRENGHVLLAENGERLRLCILVDITPDLVTRQELESQSRADPLTKVLSRAAFYDQMKILLKTAPMSDRQHAFLILDIDRFAQINGIFGHAFGDRVIEDVAQTLRSVIRAGDILGRLGGDEFVLCLKNVKADEHFRKRTDHIRALLHKRLPANTELSCSFGVALNAQNEDSVAVLLRHADIALSEAKRLGRNRVVFYTPGMERSDYVPCTTPIDSDGL